MRNFFSGINFANRVIQKTYNKLVTKKIFWACNGDFWKIRTMTNSAQSASKRKAYLKAYYELMRRNGSMIGTKAQFEGEPNFPHGMIGIFISDGARIGKNCTIFQQVTIGSNLLLDSKGLGAPRINNNCYIGAGAKIIGNITIGTNCRIGANCVVYKDMPDNSVAVLQPTRIIQKKIIDNKSQLPLQKLQK